MVLYPNFVGDALRTRRPFRVKSLQPLQGCAPNSRVLMARLRISSSHKLNLTSQQFLGEDNPHPLISTCRSLTFNRSQFILAAVPRYLIFHIQSVPLSNMSVSDAVTEPISDPRSLEKSVSDMKLEDDTTQSSSAAASARNIPAGPLKTPILKPLDGCVPPPAAALTPEQQLKYEKVLETVKGWKEIPSGNGTAGPIAENEIFWLTRECLLRCLRAAKWNTNDAIKRLMDTLIWRREYGVENLTGDYISPENETGKQIILGYDNSGRPCHYLNPGRQNTNPSPRQVQHMVFMLERVLELAPPGQETLALLINFKSNKNRSNTAPGISTGREVLHILQTHYPERMGRALIINGKSLFHDPTVSRFDANFDFPSTLGGLGLLQTDNPVH